MSSLPLCGQMHDTQISHSMTIVIQKVLNPFSSILSLFQVSSEHARLSAVPRSLFMLLLPLCYHAFIRSLSVLLSRISFMFLTVGTEYWELGKRAGYTRVTSLASFNLKLYAYLFVG